MHRKMKNWTKVQPMTITMTMLTKRLNLPIPMQHHLWLHMTH